MITGRVWKGSSPYVMGGMKKKVYKDVRKVRDAAIKGKLKGYSRISRGKYRLNKGICETVLWQALQG